MTLQQHESNEEQYSILTVFGVTWTGKLKISSQLCYCKQPLTRRHLLHAKVVHIVVYLQVLPTFSLEFFPHADICNKRHISLRVVDHVSVFWLSQFCWQLWPNHLYSSWHRRLRDGVKPTSCPYHVMYRVGQSTSFARFFISQKLREDLYIVLQTGSKCSDWKTCKFWQCILLMFLFHVAADAFCFCLS